jgi:Asp-tRNA(Asn)/Glu-tRNA(Gln) amidotransferase A subunit family amidase
MPAISVPCGFTEGRLPCGLQLTARPLDEVTMFKVANAYETAR